MAVTRFSAYGGPYSDNSFAGEAGAGAGVSTRWGPKLWIGLSIGFLLQVRLFVMGR